MRNLPKHSVLLAFTDNPTKNLELRDALIRMRDEKDIRVFIILAPKYHGITTDESWKLFQRLADGRVFNMDKLTVDDLLKEFVTHLNNSCATPSCIGAPNGARGRSAPVHRFIAPQNELMVRRANQQNNQQKPQP
jgi:hypothetical protein